jgi:hypothetical protein
VRAIRLIAGAVAVAAALGSGAAAAPEQVTIEVRPTVTRWLQPLTLFGAVDSRRAEDIVTIEAKDCGQQAFREIGSARTGEGGTWSRQSSILITTTFRAVWNERASAQVTVRARPGVVLRQRAARRFDVSVQGHSGGAMFWRKRVLFQRLDRRLGRWATVKQIVLADSNGAASFRASIPRGSVVRAVLPLSQARPCYLAGYSPPLRT